MEKVEVKRPDWTALLESVLTEPGRLGDYYRAFHNYSLGNQAIAVEQLCARGIDISPIASFNAWKEKGRSVMKGQKAIALWMPIVLKGKSKGGEGEVGQGSEVIIDGLPSRRIFVMRNNWFAFSQTQPDPHGDAPSETPPVLPEISWNKDQALANLGITEEPFAHVDGNCQGFARPTLKQIAVSPLAAFPFKSRFHELAHCLLHVTEDVEMVCGIDLAKDLKEAEAESTAFLCCAALGLPGLAESRGYVQSWLSSTVSREQFKKSAGRVFSAADKILKAGLIEIAPQDADTEKATAEA